MKLVFYISTLLASSLSGIGFAQEITPEPPQSAPGQVDDVTIELAYFGLSTSLTERVTAQAYGAYGFDDDLGLAIVDLGRSIHENVSIGGRYVYFGSDGGSDQHSFWGYLNAERYYGPSWRIDTRQVVEQRFETSGVDERTRYRPRVRLSYFGKLSERNYQLYASVEPILNLTDDNDDQTSWAGGGFLQLSSNIQVNAFYQFTETDRGPDIHFPGVGVLVTY